MFICIVTSWLPENWDLFSIKGNICLFTPINTHWLGQSAQLSQSQTVWLLSSHRTQPGLDPPQQNLMVRGSRAALGAEARAIKLIEVSLLGITASTYERNPKRHW